MPLAIVLDQLLDIFSANTMDDVWDGGFETGDDLILQYETCLRRHGIPFGGGLWPWGNLCCLWWQRRWGSSLAN